MAHSYARRENIRCHSCERTFPANIWIIVDAAERPDLAKQIREGSLFDFACPYCNHGIGKVDAPLLVFRLKESSSLIFSPVEGTTPQEYEKDFQVLLGLLRKSLDNEWQDEYKDNVQIASQIELTSNYELSVILNTLANTGSWDECRRVINQYPELLSNDADELLERMINFGRTSRGSEFAQTLEAYRRLLHRCRDLGVEPALAQEEVRGIQLELSRLDCPSDVPRYIQLCERALTLIQPELDSQLWAGIQGNLGNLYFGWAHGNRADNIERAIQAFEALNTVYTKETHGEEWAFAQFDLAKAYYARLCGDPAKNIERAIQAWENTLLVFTLERTPQEWATTLNNLGKAYVNRVRGNRDENLAQAIQLLDQVLGKNLEQSLPKLWAIAQENLGDAFQARAEHGDVDGIKRAIQAWENALLVYSPRNSPEDWAGIQSKLGFAFYRLASSNPADKRHAGKWEQAVNAFRAALSVFTRECHPNRWVEMQYNLAATLLHASERSDDAPKIDIDYKSISKMFLDVADFCARSTAPNKPAVEYGGLSMQGSARALLKMPEADRKPEQIWAQLDSAAKILWQIEVSKTPIPAQSRTAIVKGLINTSTLMIEQGSTDDRREIGFSWLRRVLECAEKLGDQELIASARYQIAWQTEQNEQGDPIAVRRYLISLYEDALVAARPDPEQFLSCLEHLIYHRSVLFCRTRKEQRANIAQLLHLVADGDAVVPRERPELRRRYLEWRVRAYDRVLREIEPYADEPLVVSALPMLNVAGEPRISVTPAEIREDIVQSIKEAIELSESLGQTYQAWSLLWDLTRLLHTYGQIEEAKLALARADALGVAALPWGQESQLLSTRAGIAELEGSYKEALRLYKQAADALIDVPIPQIRLGAKLYLANRAQLLISLERWEDAFKDLQQALGLEEAYLKDWQQLYPIQEEHAVINLKGHLGWLSEFSQPIYANMARVCVHLGRLDDALQYSERARGGYMRRHYLALNRSRYLPAPVILDSQTIMRCTGEPSGVAFLQYLIHDGESHCYVVIPGHLEVFTLPGREAAEMANLRRGKITLNGRQVPLRQLAEAHAEHPENPKRLRRWCQGLDEVGLRMYDVLVAPLASYLKKHDVQRLIISSHAGLEQLPWNAICYDASGVRRYLAEDFVLYKIPSATMLQYASSHDRIDLGSNAFVWDRGSGLRYVAFEEQMVQKAVKEANGELSVRSFQDTDCFYEFLAGNARIHIACHGIFDDEDPFLSNLLLDTEHDIMVQLADLLSSGRRLKPGCSIVLSACETGLVAPDQGGEYVSLSTGFMLAGARQIVAPLWAVNDLATSLLMGKFYTEWAKCPGDAPGALHEAQCWLRRQSRDQLAATVEDFMRSTPIDLALRLRLIQIQKYFRTHKREIPYAHPHWWGGFELTGSR